MWPKYYNLFNLILFEWWIPWLFLLVLLFLLTCNLWNSFLTILASVKTYLNHAFYNEFAIHFKFRKHTVLTTVNTVNCGKGCVTFCHLLKGAAYSSGVDSTTPGHLDFFFFLELLTHFTFSKIKKDNLLA